jgi:hypothetical protein
MKLRSKSELLAHYAAFEEPNKFIQFDGFDWPGDCMANPETGLALFHGETHELMHGADVRILVNPRTDREKVLQILYGLVAWIERDEDKLVWGMNYDDQIMFLEIGGIARYRGKYYEIKSEADLEALRHLRAQDHP